MKWKSADGRDNRVVTSSGWKNLSNYEGLEQRAGVYIFANVNLQVKYVGKAGPRRMVYEIKKAITRGKNFGATSVRALYTNSDANAVSLRKDLIDIYDPPNNRS